MKNIVLFLAKNKNMNNSIPDDNRTRAQFNAYIGTYLSFGGYLESYSNAFEVLIKEVHKTGFHVDHLAYPILFIARHCLELGFKSNIRYFSKYSQKDNSTKKAGHYLEGLFNDFKLHVRETIRVLKTNYGIEIDKEDIKDFEMYCKDVEKLTNIFHSLDKSSDSFRYPVDRNNNNSFDYKETINLLDIKELFDRSIILLKFTTSLFEKYTILVDEVKDSYIHSEMINI